MQIKILFQDSRSSTHKKDSRSSTHTTHKKLKLNGQMFANGASYLLNIF